MDPNQPRLLADFAATPTRTERVGARRYWQQQQSSLLDLTAEPTPSPCACCSSTEHTADRCPHGDALTLI